MSREVGMDWRNKYKDKVEMWCVQIVKSNYEPMCDVQNYKSLHVVFMVTVHL